MEGFPVAIQLDVRFSEMDAQGVVHNAAYLVWFENARIEYIARLPGGYSGLVDRGVDVTTVEAYVRYRAATRFGDVLRVHVRVGEIKGPRFRFDYAVERDGQLVAEGWTMHACVDASTLRPIRLPSDLLETIERVEGAAA